MWLFHPTVWNFWHPSIKRGHKVCFFFFFWPIVGSTIPHKRDGGGGRNYRILCQNFSYHLTLIKNFYRWESNYCMVAIISWLQRNSYSFAYPSLNFKQRTKIRIKSKASSIIIYVLTSYKSDLYFWWFSIAVFSSNPRIVISRPLFFFFFFKKNDFQTYLQVCNWSRCGFCA